MNIINLGILAHVDAGKTTVTESLLHTAGATRHLGRVDHGDTVTDSLGVERERGITVKAATVSLRYLDVKINILDTPGHVDFIAEVERSLAVLDAAVIVVSAREGVQAQTAVLFHTLQKLNIPTLIFLNKLDRLGADPGAVLGEIKTQLSQAVLLRQKISGEGRDVSVKMLSLGECEGVMDLLFQADEEIASLYVQDRAIPSELLWSAYLRAVRHCAVYPVYAGAALLEKGIPALLKAIAAELPRAEDDRDGLCALVYKLEYHERLGRICYLRMFRGAVGLRKTVPVQGTEAAFRITQLFTPEAGVLQPADEVDCGDIAVIPCNEFLHVGAVLGDTPPPAAHVSIAEPLLLAEVCAGEDVPREKLLDMLHKLCLEDPLLALAINERTGALEVRVFGQVQMEILQALALNRYGLSIAFKEPQTIFTERPVQPGKGDVAWGDTPFEAAMGITIEPLACGSGIRYETAVDYGYLYASFQNAAREGLLGALHHGLYGWEVTDAKITLVWAEYSSVTSTPADYRSLAAVAVIRALSDARTELLEPLLSYTLTVPAAMAGRATYDLNTMRATLVKMTAQGDTITYCGLVSLDASKHYAQAVAAYTKGTGLFSVRFSGYAPFAGDRKTAVNKGYELPSKEKYLLQKAGRM